MSRMSKLTFMPLAWRTWLPAVCTEMSLYSLLRYCHNTGGAGENDTFELSCTSHCTAFATLVLATWRAYNSPPIGIAMTTRATINRINSSDVRLAKNLRPPDSFDSAVGGGGVGIEIRVVRLSCGCGGEPGCWGRGLGGRLACCGWRGGGGGCCGGRRGGRPGCCGRGASRPDGGCGRPGWGMWRVGDSDGGGG